MALIIIHFVDKYNLGMADKIMEYINKYEWPLCGLYKLHRSDFLNKLMLLIIFVDFLTYLCYNVNVCGDTV